MIVKSLKNQLFETVFKNHCCNISDKTQVFVRINRIISSQQNNEFSAIKTLFCGNDFNETSVTEEIM